MEDRREPQTEIVRSSESDGRQPWIAPQVRVLRAGSAEDGGGVLNDLLNPS